MTRYTTTFRKEDAIETEVEGVEMESNGDSRDYGSVEKELSVWRMDSGKGILVCERA